MSTKKRIASVTVTFTDSTSHAMTLGEIKKYMKPRIDWGKVLRLQQERTSATARANSNKRKPALGEEDRTLIIEAYKSEVHEGRKRGWVKLLALEFIVSESYLHKLLKAHKPTKRIREQPR